MLILLSGIKMGLVLALLVGPVFFTLIQTSIEHGLSRGCLVASGVALSDATYVAGCYFGLVQFMENPVFSMYMGLGGGIILIGFGFYYLLVKSRKVEPRSFKAAHAPTWWRYVLKGFVINGLSPMVLIFWVGAISLASLDLGYTRGYEFFLFFAAVLSTVFGTDVLKAYLADKLSRLITARLLRMVNIMVGVGMLIFGVRLLLQVRSF